MTPTAEYVESKIGEFNALVFGSCLPPISVKLSKARSFLGRVEYRKKRSLFGRKPDNLQILMRISTAFDLPEREQEDVIIHELIHCYIAFKGLRDSSTHGRLFRSMMERINREYGRNVTVSHKMAPGAVNPRLQEVRLNCICVSLLKNGRWGVTVCTEAMMKKLDGLLPRYYAIQERHWYTSTDPFFNRYPRSRTAKIYKISREDLDVHLPDPDTKNNIL